MKMLQDIKAAMMIEMNYSQNDAALLERTTTEWAMWIAMSSLSP